MPPKTHPISDIIGLEERLTTIETDIEALQPSAPEPEPPDPVPPAGHDEVHPGDDWQAIWQQGREFRWMPGTHPPQSLRLPRGGSAADPLSRFILMDGATLDGGVEKANSEILPGLLNGETRLLGVWAQPTRTAARHVFDIDEDNPPWNYRIEGEGLGSIHEHWQAAQQKDGWFGGKAPVNCEMFGLVIRRSGFAGVRFGVGFDYHDLVIYEHAQEGFSGLGSGGRYHHNEQRGNNTLRIDPVVEVTSKFVYSDPITVEFNHVYDEHGRGIWGDIDNQNVLIQKNLIERCHRAGILAEINLPKGLGVSAPPFVIRILDNIIDRCGENNDTWGAFDAQILVQNSSAVEVAGNKVTVAADYGNGISVLNQKRPSGEDDPAQRYFSRQVSVHHNEITWLGPGGKMGILDDTSSRGGPHGYSDGSLNVDGQPSGTLFDFNTHIVFAADVDARRFTDNWPRTKRWLTFPEFQAEGHEAHGQMLTR